MTKREKRLIAVLGAHTRLRETTARRHDPKIADALVLHLRKVIRALTAKECLLIHEASMNARDAAYDQVIAWSQRKFTRHLIRNFDLGDGPILPEK